MIEFFLVVGGIGGFAYLSSKISHLEAKITSLENGKVLPSSPTHTPLTLTPALHVQPSIVALITPAGAAIPPPPPPQLAPLQPTTFNEESGGRLLGRLGIAAIFIGIAFFLKYAFDTNLIGVVGRILLGVTTGLVFVSSGQYLRAKYKQYAYLLIGGGVAILYLSFYTAFALYNLLSQPVAFALMLLVTICTVGLSLLDDSEPLAILASVGGFATPYLISTGHNDPVALFTYIAILDIAVVALAIRKNWTALTHISFVATGFQYFVWYGMYYSREQLGVAFMFLTLFYFMYLSIPGIHTLVVRSKTTEVDLGLATINAFGYFATAYLLLNSSYHEILWMLAVILGAIYFALAYSIYTFKREDPLLSRYYAGIATIFITLAIPLKLEHSWITLAWLLEALLLYILSFDYKFPSLKMFAGVVYILAVAKLFFEYSTRGALVQTPFFNVHVALFVVAILVAYFAAYMYNENKEVGDAETNLNLASFFFVVANILSVYIITAEITALYTQMVSSAAMPLNNYDYNSSYTNPDISNQRNTVISIVWSVYSILLIIIGFSAKIRIARILGLIFFFLTAGEIFLTVWSLGELYRIVASIVFGAIALLGSFLYVKYSQRIKEIIYQN